MAEILSIDAGCWSRDTTLCKNSQLEAAITSVTITSLIIELITVPYKHFHTEMHLTENVFAVVGAKGGVGKTTTSVNLAACFSETMYSAVAVEFDIAMANVIDFIDLDVDESEATTLHEVLGGEAGIEEACYPVKDEFSVAMSGTDIDGYTDADLSNLPQIIDKLQWLYDVVILDTPAGVSTANIEPLKIADAALLVTTPRVASIRNAQSTLEIARRVRTEPAGLIVTKSGTGNSPGADRIAEFLGVDLLGHVPGDDAIPHSQDNGKPVVEYAPQSGAAIAYRKIAKNIIEQEVELETGEAAGDGPNPLDPTDVEIEDIFAESDIKPWDDKFPWEEKGEGGEGAESSEIEPGSGGSDGDLEDSWPTVDSYFPDADEDEFPNENSDDGAGDSIDDSTADESAVEWTDMEEQVETGQDASKSPPTSRTMRLDDTATGNESTAVGPSDELEDSEPHSQANESVDVTTSFDVSDANSESESPKERTAEAELAEVDGTVHVGGTREEGSADDVVSEVEDTEQAAGEGAGESASSSRFSRLLSLFRRG